MSRLITYTRCSVVATQRAISILLVPFAYLAHVFPRGMRPAIDKEQSHLSSTAYLDALRGYAAYIVYNSHVIHEEWRPETSFIMRFPFAKIWFRGHGMVDVFFVISGYALSYSMLKSIHSKQHAKVLHSLASATLRRYLRLFAPTAMASFVAMIVIGTGLARKGEPPEVVQSTILENLRFWVIDTTRSSSPFQHVVGWWYGGCFGTKYLPQMWTIPVEFRGSVVLFMFLAATCKMKTVVRLWTTWVCILAFFWWEATYAGEFLMGMWIADLKLHRAKQSQNQASSPLLLISPSTSLTSDEALDEEKGLLDENLSRLDTSWAAILVKALQQVPIFVIFILSLFICSSTPLIAPIFLDTKSRFPFNVIAWFMPPNYDQGAQIHFPLAIGAFMLVYALDNSTLLQRPLQLPISQFMGELSFGIYAMHNTIRWIVWEDHFVKWQEEYFGNEHGFWQLLPGYLLMTTLVFWSAELFRRADVKIVAWTKVLQGMCFEKE